MLAYIYKCSLTFINVASHLQMLACIYKCESTFTNVSSRTLLRQMAPHSRAFVAATSERHRSAVVAMSQRCVPATSERCRSDVAAMSQRCRNDVADDNAPLGIAPLGHRTLLIALYRSHARCISYAHARARA